MKIQINTDNHIEGSQDLLARVRSTVEDALGRFDERLTRIEVHLTDVNAHKGGRDIRCVMEARMAGVRPVTVDDLAETVEQAARGAAGKLERALESRLGRRGR